MARTKQTKRGKKKQSNNQNNVNVVGTMRPVSTPPEQIVEGGNGVQVKEEPIELFEQHNQEQAPSQAGTGIKTESGDSYESHLDLHDQETPSQARIKTESGDSDENHLDFHGQEQTQSQAESGADESHFDLHGQDQRTQVRTKKKDALRQRANRIQSNVRNDVSFHVPVLLSCRSFCL